MHTKLRNVAGISRSSAQKAIDLFTKTRYMDELTNNKGNIHATGTPLTNTLAEMYTNKRYLQYDILQKNDLAHFDAWVSTFSEVETTIELAPEGTGYRARTRLATFHNLPELMAMFRNFADIQTADMLNLPVPEVQYENIILEPSELQKEMVASLSERARLVQAREVDAKIDNMLKITTDGRKIGLDQRLMNPMLPESKSSKSNVCAEKVFEIWKNTKSKSLTQLVFCDFSTPKKDGSFNMYDDIKAKLIEKGIPEHELAFIHDYSGNARKKELFAKMRKGKIRVLLGSTAKMGAGTNVQDKLIATHDADCPWRPADLEQRAGRIIRYGNKNPNVMIFRYATQGTFDSYLWQTVEAKQKFIAQIMTSKSPVRSCEDVDATALTYAEIKALCAGNPLIAEKMNLDVEVAKLRMIKSEHQSSHYRLEDALMQKYPRQIAELKARIAGIEKDIAMYDAHKGKVLDNQTFVTANFSGMTIHNTHYTDKESAAYALLDNCKTIVTKEEVNIGSYMGFDMGMSFCTIQKMFNLSLRGAMTYQVELGADALGNITRINNALETLPRRLTGNQTQLEEVLTQQNLATQELQQPFHLEDELAEKESRLAQLNSELNVDRFADDNYPDNIKNAVHEEDNLTPHDHAQRQSEDASTQRRPAQLASAKSSKPSFLDGIRAYNDKQKQPLSGVGKHSTQKGI